VQEKSLFNNFRRPGASGNRGIEVFECGRKEFLFFPQSGNFLACPELAPSSFIHASFYMLNFPTSGHIIIPIRHFFV
jgi:hypothetical protein